jgi:hypothetical protein
MLAVPACVISWYGDVFLGSSPIMYLSVLTATLLSVITVNGAPSSAGCKAFPGDQAWPSTADWDAFNQTVGGRLVATVPLGTPCHGSTFDNATCEDLKSKWQAEEIQ